MESKQWVRKKALSLRNAMNDCERSKKSAIISNKIVANSIYEQNSVFLLYATIKSEVDLSSFIEKAYRDGKIIYFPRVSKDDMEFYRVDSIDELEEGSFGVMEPALLGDDRVFSDLENTYPVLVPGVAFSRKGDRIGYGKGFYDRYLKRYPNLYTIGISFDIQLLEPWDKDDCDIRMQKIITEKEEVTIND